MEITRQQPSTKGPADWFTGDVWIDTIRHSSPHSVLSVISVLFTPEARTAWHAHSGGQTLHITSGHGLIQSRDHEVVSVRPGDTVHTPADEWHWHGATPDHTMTHLSITEGPATFGDHVTDADYHAAATATPPEE